MDEDRICLEKLTTPMAAHLLEKRRRPQDEKLPDLRVDDLCPSCGRGRLAFNNLLNLTCQKCMFQLAGGST